MALPSIALAHATSKADSGALSAADLAYALDVLEVPFIAGGFRSPAFQMPQPAELMVSLATSEEARIRLALIPLLLCHPEFSHYVASTVRRMPPTVQTGFKCYYTAAMLLQQKHWKRLAALFGSVNPLPDLFSSELLVHSWSDPDGGLALLAERQTMLTGRAINWLGTYEHGAERLLRTLERRTEWPA